MHGSASIHAAGYAAAALVGAWFAWLVMPAEVLLGTGAMWAAPPADLAQNLTGHLAYQQEPWQWPPFLARSLRWPDGASIALTDSNPLASVLAKLAAGVAGRPVNLFGAWLALCLVLQPVAATYAVRSLGATSVVSALAAAVVSLSFSAFLARLGHAGMGHINLMGHFLLLFALGWSVRRVAGRAAPWWQASLLALVAIFTHPFVFVLLCAVFAAPVAASLLARRGVVAALAGFAASTALPYGLFAWLAGVTGGGDHGYGLYSMNLAAPFWPQLSGVFGPGRAVVDATSGQYEGLTYLGAGGLLLLLAAAWLLATRRAALPAWRSWLGHAAVLLVLAAMAVSHKAYLGRWPVLVFESSSIERWMGPVRASGRLFWPAAYLLVLVPLALVARRLPPAPAAALLGLAALLQWVDAAPLRASVQAFLRTGHPDAQAVALPAGGQRLMAVTGCTLPGAAGAQTDRLRLAAVRAGMALETMRFSRDPTGQDCATVISDALEIALLPGDVRAYVGAPAMAPLRTELLGPEARCRTTRAMTLCAADPATGWEAEAIGAALPTLAAGGAVEGAGLQPHLGWGWQRDREGRHWSNGPRAVLLLRMPAMQPGATARLRLEVEGVGRQIGQPQRVLLAAGPNTAPLPEKGAAEVWLADGQVTHVAIAVSGAPDSIVRVAIRIPDPVDARVRGTPLPVRWAGLLLHRIALTEEAAARRD